MGRSGRGGCQNCAADEVAVSRILVIISDVTAHILRECTEREQRETVLLFHQITGGRAGFEELLDEASELVATLATAGDPTIERRALHTLKRNCAIYRLETYAELCDTVESELTDAASPIPAEQRLAPPSCARSRRSPTPTPRR